ncbi:MAG: tetratricopeptide repeat protein [Gammaproteobacteria bacterium]|nr:tetratricopeptide repeat protein [Gammaproteobacteria bacterium]
MSKGGKSRLATMGAHGSDAELQRLQASALQYLQAGNLNEAEAIYREIIARQPHHADTLNNLGLLAHQRGAQDKAGEYLTKALALNASNPLYVNNLGLVRKAQRKVEEAEACHRKAIALWPDYPEAHYNLGVALQDQGRLDEAANAYREATRLKPTYPKAYYNLATVQVEQDRLEDAVASYMEALSLDPRMAEAHNNLANVLRRLGNLKEAEKYLWRSIELKPDYANAYYNLGLVLRALENTDGALECFREAVRLSGGDLPAARVNLGSALLLQGHIGEAEKWIQEALDHEPEDPLAHCGLGDVRAAEGQHEAAIETYRKVLSIRPDFGPAYIGLAKAKKFSMEDSDLISEIENLLRHKKDDKDEEMALHFALGKIYDDCRDCDKAFAHYEKANALKHRLVDFDQKRHIADVSDLIATYTAELFQRHRGHGSNSELPIFIVGTPRSGTTLVEQVLAAHPSVHGAGELKFLGRQAAELPKRLATSAAYPECVKLLTPALIGELVEAYLEHLRGHCGDSKVVRVTNKMPSNFYYIGLISILFPRARIIHCRRDPLDACLSMYFQSFNTGHRYSYDLADLGVWYNQYRRLMAHWRHVLPGRLIEVDYEELVNDQEIVSRALVGHCGLQWDDACLKFYRHKRPVLTASGWQVRQPIYKTAVKRWKHYEKHLGVLIDALNAWK